MPLDRTKLQLGPANVYFKGELLGYLGDDVSVNIVPTTSPLTGAQAGTAPLDKVMTGGRVFVTVPLKEISLSKLATGIVAGVLVTGSVPGEARLDFVNRVGLSLRSLAGELRLVALAGEDESTNPDDTYVCPEASPADSEVKIPFSPTEQRMIAVTFEAWPNDTTKRWMYSGDEVVTP